MLTTATQASNLTVTTKLLSALMESLKFTLLLNSLTLNSDSTEMLNTASKFALATLAVLVSVLNPSALINALDLSLLPSQELSKTRTTQPLMSSGTTTPLQLATTRDATTPLRSALMMANQRELKPPGTQCTNSPTLTLQFNTASRLTAAMTVVTLTSP